MKLQRKESTYKSKATEEFLDKVFYRRLGYYVSLACQKLGITPNAVTYMSIVIGVISGHFFYYNNSLSIIIGIILFIISDIFDSTDGQLARMTGNQTEMGRILDGIGGNLIFISIYIHVCLNLINQGYGYPVVILTVLSMSSHGIQSALADYYKNIFLYFSEGEHKSELETSAGIREKINNSKRFSKIILWLYFLYTKEQEFLANSYKSLFAEIKSRYNNSVPAGIRALYKEMNINMIKYYNILTINTRVIILFICLLIHMPIAYLIIELTVFNLLLLFVILTQRFKNNLILSKIISETI